MVLPAARLDTPLLLVRDTFADRVFVKAQVESARGGGVKTTERAVPDSEVELGVIATPVSSFVQVTADTYFVMLVLAPDVSVTVMLPDVLCW